MTYIRKPKAKPPPSDQHNKRIAELLYADKCTDWEDMKLKEFQASYEQYGSLTRNQKAKIDQIWRKRREGK